LISPKNPIVRQVTDFFSQQHAEKNMEFPDALTAEKIRMDTALAYDSGLLNNGNWILAIDNGYFYCSSPYG
jgi:hypothetical protein